MIKKDPANCPFCEAEKIGVSSGWGFSPEGWNEIEKWHLEEHCDKCPTCGQPIRSTWAKGLSAEEKARINEQS